MIDAYLEKLATKKARLTWLEAEIKRWQAEVPPEKLDIDIGADHYELMEPRFALNVLNTLLASCKRNYEVLRAELNDVIKKLITDLNQG